MHTGRAVGAVVSRCLCHHRQAQPGRVPPPGPPGCRPPPAPASAFPRHACWSRSVPAAACFPKDAVVLTERFGHLWCSAVKAPLALWLWSAVCLVRKSESSCVQFAGFLMQGLSGWGSSEAVTLGFSKTLWSGGRWETGRGWGVGTGEVGLGARGAGSVGPLPPPSCLPRTSSRQLSLGC